MAAGLAALFVLAAGASCSLDLDESLIGKGGGDGGALPDGALPDSPGVEGGVDTGIPVGPDASACTNDDACTTNHGCLKGKCDLTRKSCTYDVCRPSACNAATCDQNARTCGPPAAYKYRATQFTVGAQIACGKCAAAVHPWLFIVTPTGVAAFNTSNPANPSRLQLAYVDAPADPFTTKITAQTVLATYNRPGNEGRYFFGRGGDSALIVGSEAQFPATAVEAPLNEPVVLSASPMLPPQNLAPSAVSGKRLLMSAVIDQTAQFALIDNAGSPNPTTSPVVNLTDAGAVSVHRTFAQSPDGAIFWATGVHQDIGPGVLTRAARGYFLVPNEGGAIEGNVGVDLELYNAQAVGANAAIFGPNQATAAMLDAKTVMIAMQARENEQQTAVQFVTREPLGVIKDGDAPRRQVLPVPIGAFAAATASNGVGYLVANDQNGMPPSATVYVFDPACAR